MAKVEHISQSDVPEDGTFEKVGMGKRIVTSAPCLGTDSLGPCVALAAFGLHAVKGTPLLGLWHADGFQIGEFSSGHKVEDFDVGNGVVGNFKKFLLSEGMSEDGLKIHVIGGVSPDDHKYFEAVWKEKEKHPGDWKELGKFVVPFQKTSDLCATEVYLKHPKKILVNFYTPSAFTA